MIAKSVLLYLLVMMIWSSNLAESRILKAYRTTERTTKKCLTSTCNKTATMILNNMDTSVHPCENFYKFACGRYIEKPMEEDATDLMRKSLNDTSNLEEIRAVRLTKELFKSCTNRNSINHKSVNSLLQIIRRLGGWPVLEGYNWNENFFHWAKLINGFQQNGFGVPSLPRIFVSLDGSTNMTKRAIYLGYEPFLDEFKPTSKSSIRNSASRKMVDIAVALGANRTFAEKEFEDLFNFVSELHRANLTDDGKSIVSTIKNLPKKLKDDKIPWPTYIRNLAKKSVIIRDNEKIIINSIDSISTLNKKMNQTSKRVQANFIIWNIISESIRFLPKNIREKHRQILEGENPVDSEINDCVYHVYQLMPVGTTVLYIRDNFDENDRQDAIEIYRKIQIQIYKTLNGWVNEMKDEFLRKLDKLRPEIGWVDKMFDNTELEKLYQGVDIHSEDFLQNGLNLELFSTRSEFSKLRDLFDGNYDWKSMNLITSYLYSLENSSFYIRFLNTIVIPATFLRSVLNRKDNLSYIKFGASGFSIGHDIYHAFDFFGRHVDENRNKFDEFNDTIFHNNDICLIDQYKNSSINRTIEDGVQFLAENFADNAGIKVAYLAYVDQLKRDEPQLEGLNYSPKQMFWISFANNWCERQEDYNLLDSQNSHAPSEFRVSNTVSNMKEFSEDFNCSARSLMNPKEKCSLW